MTTTLWKPPHALIPVRARVVVPGQSGEDGLAIAPPTLAEALAFLGAAAVTTGTVVIRNWESLGLSKSGDRLRQILASMGLYVVRSTEGLTCTSRSTSGHLNGVSADLCGSEELVRGLVPLALFADDECVFSGLAAASELIGVILQNISALGGSATWDGDSLRIQPAPLHAGIWDCAGDAVLALAGATVALIVQGIDVQGLASASSELAADIRAWTDAMLADQHILPGTSAGSVPYYD